MATTPDKYSKIGFNNEAYIKAQTASILERVDRYQEKLYIEFGGKIMYDYHASRVLPGFDPNVKMRLLQQLAGHGQSAPERLCVSHLLEARRFDRRIQLRDRRDDLDRRRRGGRGRLRINSR